MDADQFLGDVRLAELAGDFYHHTTIDSFPCDSDPDDYDNAKYELDLEVYAMSMMNVVNWFFILLINGEVDLEQSFDEDHFYMNFVAVDYEKEDHSSALAILRDLAQHLAIIYHTY